VYPGSSSSPQSTIEVEIECTEGMRFDTGSASSDFVMVVKGWKVELVTLVVLLSEKKISLREVIIAEDVDKGHASSTSWEKMDREDHA
jgi:hypothetical protein